MKTLLLALSLTLVLLRTAAAQNAIESELFSPDFLAKEHEAIGLSDAQVEQMQALVQDVQPKFEALKTLLGDKVKALMDTLHQDKPDLKDTEGKLRNMLTQENEMKVLQLDIMLTLRNKLTPEQLAKARELRAQSLASSSSAGNSPSSSSAPSGDLRERLQAKFQQLKSAAEALASSGQPPEEIINKAHEIQQLVQNGKPEEAEKALDALLATLPKAKP